MAVRETKEKRFESDIEAFFLSPAGGYTRGTDVFDPLYGVFPQALVEFVKDTQEKAWRRFCLSNKVQPERCFLKVFKNACERDGMLSVLRKGFKHRGIHFALCYFKPESGLNETARLLYEKNRFECYRQWFYGRNHHKSVDMVLTLNGIPVFAFELKNQYTGQTVENAKRQWMYDRDPRELCFMFNRRVLAFFCVDHTNVFMTTRLAGRDTVFLPFNQGSAGAGRDGGAGNPPNPEGYPTSYLWEQVFARDSMLDIIEKFIHLELPEGQGNPDWRRGRLIFPRYHQLDVVRKLVADVREHGSGRNYLVQHSAGSGKSNSIAWTAYRLASLFNAADEPMFSSVVVVTDRRVLDRQLQETISGFAHMEGSIETIGENKTSQDLKRALNEGARIIVTTLQKFPVIYDEVDRVAGRRFAVIVDEAHSSQTGRSATKLKAALVDPEEALKEYAEWEGKAEEELDASDPILREMLLHGRHENLSFFAFTATPKDKTLEMFGTQDEAGQFRPFHVYSMRQAIEEGFILDVLQNYMTYRTYFKIAKTIQDNPELPESRAAKLVRRYQELHPYNIQQKSAIIVERFMDTTRHKINGRGKMMVVTSSRLAAVRYYQAIRKYAREHRYDDVQVLVAFSGTVRDGGVDYTESGLNVRADGSSIAESQTKAEFHDHFSVLVVAEKYQTGFDEPLLHTMIVDKRLRGVKAVQTLSRLNRIYPGKTDTFVLDFVNSAEDIQAAFQPFYQETLLTDAVNADLLYETQRRLQGYGVYGRPDVEAFVHEYGGRGKQDERALGRLTSILLPVAERYEALSDHDRYEFRRELRNFIKWYGYVSQVARMFDRELHEEYVFCSYLVRLLPEDPVEKIDLAGKLRLEYYKLEQTFQGEINLVKEPGKFEPATKPGSPGLETRSPLDEILDKVNKRYEGKFTEEDKVIISDLYRKLISNEHLRDLARDSNIEIFVSSTFPKFFADITRESYERSQEAYEQLFADVAKYEAIKSSLADVVYRSMNSDGGEAGRV